jgi:hypothetical protein
VTKIIAQGEAGSLVSQGLTRAGDASIMLYFCPVYEFNFFFLSHLNGGFRPSTKPILVTKKNVSVFGSKTDFFISQPQQTAKPTFRQAFLYERLISITNFDRPAGSQKTQISKIDLNQECALSK